MFVLFFGRNSSNLKIMMDGGRLDKKLLASMEIQNCRRSKVGNSTSATECTSVQDRSRS